MPLIVSYTHVNMYLSGVVVSHVMFCKFTCSKRENVLKLLSVKDYPK